MTTSTNSKKNSIQIQAIIAAFMVTLVTGLTILALGANAILNQNNAQTKDSPLPMPEVVQAAENPSNLEQLQALIAQYQSREQQYQTELNLAAQRVEQAYALVQQDQAQLAQYETQLTLYETQLQQVQIQLPPVPTPLPQYQASLLGLNNAGPILKNSDEGILILGDYQSGEPDDD